MLKTIKTIKLINKMTKLILFFLKHFIYHMKWTDGCYLRHLK